MKNRKQRKIAKSKAADKHQQSNVNTPALAPAPEPLGPPLEGEALEIRVAETMCEGFRKTDARASLRKACNGATQAAIETAIVSPRVKSVVEPVTRAFALEHSVAILHTTFSKAKRALESEKPTAAEITALKIVMEIFIEKMMERIEGGLWQESFSLLGFSDYEKSLIENLVQLVRGQRTPVADDSQGSPDLCAMEETGA